MLYANDNFAPFGQDHYKKMVFARWNKSLLALALLATSSMPALAQELWADTFLLDVYIGSNRSSLARDLRNGGYELSGGDLIDFQDWYTPNFPDSTVLLLRQVSPDFGIIWGFSTGERGEKYKIAPALQLGFVYQFVPFENAVASISATYPFFGRMTEKTCRADYGALGGIQDVNCRLAASLIPPATSLEYLVKVRGEIDAKIGINFRFSF